MWPSCNYNYSHSRLLPLYRQLDFGDIEKKKNKKRLQVESAFPTSNETFDYSTNCTVFNKCMFATVGLKCETFHLLNEPNK